MVLLISPSSRAQDCAEALEGAVGESVEVALNVWRACSHLRHSEFTAVVIDEPVLESEPDALEIILQGSGIAVPIYVNIAISSCQRIIAEVKNGLRRYNEERLVAMRSASDPSPYGVARGGCWNSALGRVGDACTIGSARCGGKAEVGMPVGRGDPKSPRNRSLGGDGCGWKGNSACQGRQLAMAGETLIFSASSPW